MKKNALQISRLNLIIALSFFISLVSGCSKNLFSHGGAKTDEMPFSSLYPTSHPSDGKEIDMTMEAMDYFDRGRYSLASDTFKKIRDQYPFSPYAVLAELHIADCKFYEHEYEEAIPLYEEFEKMHPNNEAVPYVIFQEGSCYHRLMSTPDRDQTNTHKLIDTYDRLIKRYPNSPYTFEAKRRIAEAREMLAESEMVVAKWYMRVGQYPQAKARLENVINLYPDTRASLDARSMLNRINEAGTGGKGSSWFKRFFSFL